MLQEVVEKVKKMEEAQNFKAPAVPMWPMCGSAHMYPPSAPSIYHSAPSAYPPVSPMYPPRILPVGHTGHVRARKVVRQGSQFWLYTYGYFVLMKIF